jgi:hypothetical protein
MTGHIRAFADLQLLATVSATLALIAIVAGNWLYIYYRAPVPDSPRSYFMKNMPEVHKVFFEFKETTMKWTSVLTATAALVVVGLGPAVAQRGGPAGPPAFDDERMTRMMTLMGEMRDEMQRLQEQMGTANGMGPMRGRMQRMMGAMGDMQQLMQQHREQMFQRCPYAPPPAKRQGTGGM